MAEAGMHFVDWIVFAITVAISSGIGLYQAFSGGKQKTTHDYLSGGDRIGVWPATLSMTVSFISSILVLGYPAEMYTFGIQNWLGVLGRTVGGILAILIYVPVLYPLKTTTANEYVALRFKSNIARVVIAIYTMFTGVLYAAIVTFGQATAMEAVSGFPVWGTILIIMVAATIYTTLGGLRGVVWTDVFQTLIMLLGLATIAIVGFVLVGGFSEVFRINYDWERLNLFDFDPNPMKRMNFWGNVFGIGLSDSSMFGHRQESYQRYAAMPTMNKAILVIALAVPAGALLSTLAFMVGLAMFAYYTDIGCDPLKAGKISNPNQLVPYFVISVINIPGIPGLFLSCVAAGALSTISSVLNGSAAIAWSDIIKPHFNVDQKKGTLISRVIVAVLGCIIVILAIFVEQLGGNINQMMSTFSSSTTGPMAGIFLVGMFIPWVNWKGVTVGCVVGTAFSLWVGFGSYSIDRQVGTLPTNIANCSLILDLNTNTSALNSTEIFYDQITTTTATVLEDHFTGIDRLYAISFLWMRELATCVTMVTAIIISFLTGHLNPKTVEPRLLHPWVRKCFFSKDEIEINKATFEGEEMKSFVTSDQKDEEPTE